MFIGDLTLVGTVTGAPDKRVPNPNVLLEMGYAAGTIGWSLIICIMNEHFGKREEQPFDVRNRRLPINHTLDPDKLAQKEAVKSDLTRWIRFAIDTVAQNEHEGVRKAIELLNVQCINLIKHIAHNPGFRIDELDPKFAHIDARSNHNYSAADRLLDLNLIEMVNLEMSSPAKPDTLTGCWYRWTHLGELVLIELGFRFKHNQSYIFDK